ncbi:hypothetical protein GO719_14715 [Eggerthella lenta]|uniref:hypothetical protein n=1 Tax=Eggerthella lenta TaxID=84112 RepID=UPI0012EE39F9|nr:hypothetical protein [Eggerthella lenta]MVN51597.1 hypothetical protein [Eggerthella lenta]
MDSINDLIGDAAKQLMAQADGIQNQKLKASAQRVAQTPPQERIKRELGFGRRKS